MNILVINGPNINFLGIREKTIYGDKDYAALCSKIEKKAEEKNINVEIFQSNIEGEIINKLQESYGKVDGIVINPGAYTHYSIAIFDAIQSISIPTIEVHISNIHKREEFRHKSVTAAACIGQICGLGFDGYTLAMDYLLNNIK